jgi:hypothetical protein
MTDSQKWLIVGVVLLLVVVGWVWYRSNEDTQATLFGPCVQLAGTSNDNPVYYLQNDPSFTTYSSADCSAESRISI